MIDIGWPGQVDYIEDWDMQKSMVASRSENPDLAGKLLCSNIRILTPSDGGENRTFNVG